MTVLEHLSEFRRRIFICLIAVAIAAILAFVFSNEILKWFLHFYQHSSPKYKNKTFIFTGPLDAFLIRIKIATYGGIVLASPVWLYQLWRFITPGLNPKEKRYAVPFLASSIVLFALGGVVAVFTLKPALGFLLGVGGSTQTPFLTADKYVGLVSLMILAFGISFEFPIVLMFLLLARILKTTQLRKWRRPAILFIVIFAAVITPSQDPYSLFFMAVPMYSFYEIVIVIGRILKR